jgi:hypothetical protein
MTDSRVDEFNSMPRHPTFSPSYSPAMLTLLEVIRGLHDYDEEPPAQGGCPRALRNGAWSASSKFVRQSFYWRIAMHSDRNVGIRGACEHPHSTGECTRPVVVVDA